MVYINDLVDNIQCNIQLYADDTNLYITTEDFQESSAMVHEDLHWILDWAKQWLVTYGPEKTECLHMSFTGSFNSNQQLPHLVFNNKKLKEVQHKHWQ